jgi:gliding motility-associated-like protein
MRHFLLLGLLLSFSLKAQLNDLIITEYVDWNPGAGWAIKIYNPTNSNINLSNYYVQVYNGNNNSASSSDQLSGNLAPGTATIISNANNTQASSDFQACSSNQSFSSNGVNDDDCIALTLGSGNNFIDMIGLHGTAVKSQVDGVSRALKWNKITRENGNCIRYTSTNGSANNSWPSNASTNMTGFIVSAPTCLSPGNSYSPYTSGTNSNLSICQGDSILINGRWENQAGTYNDTLSLLSGCFIINSISLTYKASPTASRNYIICPADSILINNLYFPADTSFSFLIASLSACDSLITITIESDTIKGQFSYDYLGEDSTAIVFTNQNFGYNAQWHFGDGQTNNSNDSLISHSYLAAGQYEVTLILSNSRGCQNTIRKWIYIPANDFDVTLILPNIFSPNGDGINDLFNLNNTENLSDLTFTIVNRYGQVLALKNAPPYTWDGKHQGQDCPNGTYFYSVYYQGKEQRQTLTISR